MNNILIHVDRGGDTNFSSTNNVCSINRIFVHADILSTYLFDPNKKVSMENVRSFFVIVPYISIYFNALV